MLTLPCQADHLPGRALGDAHIRRLDIDADVYGATVEPIPAAQRASHACRHVAAICALDLGLRPRSVRHRGVRLAHPVPFGFHGRYFADLRA